MIHRGRQERLTHFVQGRTIRILALYSDVCGDDGTIRPLVEGGVYNQPAWEWTALRIARGEYGRLRAEDRRKEEAKRKHVGRGRGFR
jgi:hypothetical protein